MGPQCSEPKHAGSPTTKHQLQGKRPSLFSFSNRVYVTTSAPSQQSDSYSKLDDNAAKFPIQGRSVRGVKKFFSAHVRVNRLSPKERVECANNGLIFKAYANLYAVSLFANFNIQKKRPPISFVWISRVKFRTEFEKPLFRKRTVSQSETFARTFGCKNEYLLWTSWKTTLDFCGFKPFGDRNSHDEVSYRLSGHRSIHFHDRQSDFQYRIVGVLTIRIKYIFIAKILIQRIVHSMNSLIFSSCVYSKISQSNQKSLIKLFFLCLSHMIIFKWPLIVIYDVSICSVRKYPRSRKMLISFYIRKSSNALLCWLL